MAQERTGRGLQVLLALIAAVATIAAALIGNWSSIFGPDATPAAATQITSVAGPGTPAPEHGLATAPIAVTAGGECQITVANPLAVILEEPEVFAQEAASVPAGVYPVLEIANVSFGSQEQRWFRVSVDARSGWIRDSSFDVASKTALCP